MECAVAYGYYWQHALYWNGDDWVKRRGATDDAESDDDTEEVESDDSMEISFDDKLHHDGWYGQ